MCIFIIIYFLDLLNGTVKLFLTYLIADTPWKYLFYFGGVPVYWPDVSLYMRQLRSCVRLWSWLILLGVHSDLRESEFLSEKYFLFFSRVSSRNLTSSTTLKNLWPFWGSRCFTFHKRALFFKSTKLCGYALLPSL